MQKRLVVLTTPLPPPVGVRRIFEAGLPLRGPEIDEEWLCGQCDNVLAIGMQYASLRAKHGSDQIIAKCPKCGAYNDMTPPPLPAYHPQGNLPHHLRSLLKHGHATRLELATKFESHGADDPRIAISDHLFSVVSVAYLSHLHAVENLTHADWWVAHGFDDAVKFGIVKDLLKNYDAFSTGSLMFFSFSLFENGIRRIVRAIDASACSGGNAPFNSIAQFLFRRIEAGGWQFSLGTPSTFVDLFRTFRNTLHNNGTYFPERGGDKELVWRGKIYGFEYGKIPSFTGWEFNIMLLRDLIALNREIMLSPMVTALPTIAP